MAGPKVKNVLIYSGKQCFSIASACASCNSDMPGIPVAVIPRSFIIARCTVSNSMGYVLSGAAQLEAVTIPVTTIAIIGSGTIGNGYGRWLSVQIPAVI